MHRLRFGVVFTNLVLLTSLSSARKLAWEDPSGNSMFDAYEYKSRPQHAVEAWERDKECDPDYFALTQRNLNDSGVVDWYPKYIEKMRARNPQYQGLGEVRFFSTIAWGDPNFMCGIVHKGCNTVPTQKAVVERVIKYREGRNHSLADNLAEARRIYFMAQEIHAIAEFIFYQYVS
jgi:hypothetical protein